MIALTPLGETLYKQNADDCSRRLLLHRSTKFHIWGNPEGPPCVLLHGLAGGIRLITPLAQSLGRQGFCVYAMELRDEERCLGIHHPHSLDDLSNDLQAFIDQLRLELPYLVGVSFGSLVGLHYAARFPGRISGLAIQGVGPSFESSILKRVAGNVLGRFAIPQNNPFINQFFNLFMGTKSPDLNLRESISNMVWSTDQAVMNYRFHLASEFDVEPLAESLRNLPILALRGEKDVVVSEKSFLQFQHWLPEATLKTLPDAGHLACITHPEEMARKIASYIRSDKLCRV